MSTLIETKDNSFSIFIVVFMVMSVAAGYGLATGQFKSADRIECEKYANITVAELPQMPAKCQRYFK